MDLSLVRTMTPNGSVTSTRVDSYTNGERRRTPLWSHQVRPGTTIPALTSGTGAAEIRFVSSWIDFSKSALTVTCLMEVSERYALIQCRNRQGKTWNT